MRCKGWVESVSRTPRKPSPKPKAGKASPKAVAPAKALEKKAASAKPAAKANPAPPALKAGTRTIPVHALADERIHLAAPHMGKLRQGTLRTLCGQTAVTALSPFALADKKQARCRTCFGKVDAEGGYTG